MNPAYEKYLNLIKAPIKKAIDSGYKKEYIREQLIQKHWPSEVVDEALKEPEHKLGGKDKKLILTVMYWLGLAIAASSLFLSGYMFITFLSIGILLIVLSIPMKMLGKKEKPIKKQDARPTLAQYSTPKKPETKEKKVSFFSKLFAKKEDKKIKSFSVEKKEKPITPEPKKKEVGKSFFSKLQSFFSKLFSKKKKSAETAKTEKKQDKKPEIPKKSSTKSPITAAILAFLIPGLGHFYLGENKKGLIILLTGWLIVPWLYGIIDAYKIAKEGVFLKERLEKEIKLREERGETEERERFHVLQGKGDETKKLKEKEKSPINLSKTGEKKETKSNLGIILLVLITLGVLAFFYYLFIQGKINQNNIIAYSAVTVLFSLTIFIFLVRKSKSTVKKENKKEEKIEIKKVNVSELKKDFSQQQEEYETDFDKLLKMVEKYGRLKIEDVAETFKISKKEAEEWAAILEQHELAVIHYPAFGSPEIIKKGKKKKEEDEEEV